MIAIGPRETESRHANADDVRLEPAKVFVREPEVRHDARAEIVDDDVRDRREPPRELEAARAIDVEHDAPLAAHERSREPAAAVAEIHGVASLDLDHVGAEVGEDAGGDRPGDHPREVEDADACERQHQTIPSCRSVASSASATPIRP